MNERTFHASQVHLLDDPERLQWLLPAEVIAPLPLRAGSVVADVGAGTGYFTLPLASAVGENGKVLAVDFQKEMLTRISQKLAQPNAPLNVELVEGDAIRTTLFTGSCDLVFMANLWHELDDYPAVLREATRILRQDGILAILDWRADRPSPPGPPAGHRVSADQAKTMLADHHWSVMSSQNIGQYSYLLLGSRPQEQRAT